MRNYGTGCDGKKRYTRWAVAEHDARNLRTKEREVIRPYRCKGCGGIHVGHQFTAHTKQRDRGTEPGRRVWR